MTLDPNIIVNMLSLLGVVFLGYLNLRSKAESAELKNQLGQKLDEVRREFSQGYMQIPIAAEQRQNVLFRLDNIERELHGVRERVHSTANQIGALNLTVGEFRGVAETAGQIRDSSKRWEHALEQHANRLQQLERRYPEPQTRK